MKFYVQYLTKDLKGKTIEALGSDGVFILDGRNNIATMIEDGIKQRKRLRKVKDFCGLRVMKGTRFSDNNKIIWEVALLEEA